ncbi:NUDIX hydrolase [Mangrovicoccus ximenensis]|uniref:NUDIX hydrolase n=1 Tax=Mangrovicoccus ximenensis TaxID=1911570 RepID=UPI0013751D36|nr:NUDIX hydrolase [Mangrovicoccus ximenensis]
MKEFEQIAALPIRTDAKRGTRVLLVTSRDTGRWVVPKGWPMDGKKPWAAAKIEALEEAGALGSIRDEPLGSYFYEKQRDDGPALPCRVTVYPMIFTKLKKRWKERKQRKRRWVSARQAARMVNEPELKDIFRAMADCTPLPGSKAARWRPETSAETAALALVPAE